MASFEDISESIGLDTKSEDPPSDWPKPEQGDFIIKNFQFVNGESLPELKIHYRTLGRLKKDDNGVATNAILIMHGTTGSSANFFRDVFAGKLFNTGQLLSAEEYFLILPDAIGHGESSKPSDGLRASFPKYCYTDMVRAQHILVNEHLGVNHLRLVMGTSMGGMHTWMWGTVYPKYVDALMPLASVPAQIAGRNRMMRKMAMDSIRTDPEYVAGDYQSQPRGLKGALQILAWMSSCPLRWQNDAPDRDSADKFIDDFIDTGMREKDANDVLYAFDASRDYDPRPKLKSIEAHLTAINTADDQVNPPELRILEDEIENVQKGVAIVVPISNTTIGHGTHTVAEVWKGYLADLLERSKN